MNYKLTYSDVYALCNKNQWFTSGSINQYRKLFEIELFEKIEQLRRNKWQRSDL